MTDSNDHDPARRKSLECMLWAGAGVLWTISGGVPGARLISEAEAAATKDFSFLQIGRAHV